MKRKMIAFLSAMMTIVMTTGIVLATEVDVVDKPDASTYNETYTGSNSKFTARATTGTAYVTIENTASSSRYLECSMIEYTANVGRTDYKTVSNTVLQGVQISTQIDRDTALTGYYFHTGICKYGEHVSGWYDSYGHRANQYYTK